MNAWADYQRWLGQLHRIETGQPVVDADGRVITGNLDALARWLRDHLRSLVEASAEAPAEKC